MDLILSNGEQLIKNWEYAEAKDKKKTFKKSFTVTDRRVIMTEMEGDFLTRDEIAIDTIIGFSTNYVTIKKDKKKAAVALLILGLISFIVSISIAICLHNNIAITGTVLGVLLLGVSVYCFIYKKTQGQLKIVLQTNVTSENLRRGMRAGSITNSVSARTKKNIIIEVNVQVANEIISTLGSVILVR